MSLGSMYSFFDEPDRNISWKMGNFTFISRWLRNSVKIDSLRTSHSLCKAFTSTIKLPEPEREEKHNEPLETEIYDTYLQNESTVIGFNQRFIIGNKFGHFFEKIRKNICE